jgi:hypothetical protein
VPRGDPDLLRPIYQLMLAHESGECEAAAGICDNLDLDREMVAACQLAAATAGPPSHQRCINPSKASSARCGKNFRQWPTVQNLSLLPLAWPHPDEYH